MAADVFYPVPGHRGVPKTARSKLRRVFLDELFDDFREHGRNAIAEVRIEKPALYLTAIVSLFGEERAERLMKAADAQP
jgi:hypothetical protein